MFEDDRRTECGVSKTKVLTCLTVLSISSVEGSPRMATARLGKAASGKSYLALVSNNVTVMRLWASSIWGSAIIIEALQTGVHGNCMGPSIRRSRLVKA